MDVADLIHDDRDGARARTGSRISPHGPAHLTNGLRRLTPPSPSLRELSRGSGEAASAGMSPTSSPQSLDASGRPKLPSIHSLIHVAESSHYSNGAFKGHRGRQEHTSEKRTSLRKSPVSLFPFFHFRAMSFGLTKYYSLHRQVHHSQERAPSASASLLVA